MFDTYYRVTGNRLLFVLCAIFCTHITLAQCDFEEVSAQQSISHSFNGGLLGSGVSFMDFDGDGWDDLTFGTSEGERVSIYRNNQGHFEKINLPGINSTCESKQITWVDFDNDGDKDLFFSCVNDKPFLYQNNGDLTFTNVADQMGIDAPLGSALGANWADFDRDGWLDLYMTYYGSSGNRLFKNMGGTVFMNVTQQSNVAPTIKPTFCGVVFDYDNDGWEDIYLANDRSTRNDMIKNLGGLAFEDASIASQSDLPMDAMGTTLLDMNHDGFFEVYISNSPQGNALIFNNGDGTFTDIAESSGTLFSSVGWGVNTLDFDNDGLWDLYVSGSEIGTTNLSSALYRATSTSSFELTQFEGMAADTMSSFSNAVGDFNNDGRMDIAVNNSNNTPSQLWQNSCTNQYHWLKVKLQGQISNRDGIGSTVIAYATGQPLYQYMTAGTSFMAQNTDYLHFGLESRSTVDSVIVEWPSGLRDIISNPAVDAVLTVVEGSSTYPVPVSGAAHAIDLCEGDEVTLSVDVYAEGLEILWSNGSQERSLEISESGTFSATISKDQLSFQTAEVDLEFNPNPDVSVSFTHVSETALGSITLTENNGTNSYRWNHDSEETGKVLTDLEAGTYKVWISNAGGCEIEITFNIRENVVTSLDSPLLAEIEYGLDQGRLVIQLPSDLAPRLKEARLVNAQGRELQMLSPTQAQYRLQFAPIPKDQLVIIHLLFTDGKVVKKLMVRE